MRPQSYRQRLFVEHCLGESSVSAIDAARRAGYIIKLKAPCRKIVHQSYLTGCTLPSKTVPQMAMSLSFIGATVIGSSSRTVKLATLPGAMEPISCSILHEWAALIVIARRACSTLMRWSLPAIRPEVVERLTAHQAR